MRSLFSKLLVSYLLLTIGVLSAVGLATSVMVERNFYAAKEQELINQIFWLAEDIGGLDAQLTLDLYYRIRYFEAFTNSIVVFVLADNTTRILSRNSSIPRFESFDVEIKYPLKDKPWSARGYDERFGEHMLVIGVPVPKWESLKGIVVYTPLLGIRTTLARIRQVIFQIGLATFLLVIVVGYIISRFITKPLERITDAVDQLSEGNYSGRIEARSYGEIGRLAHAFNRLSQRLDETVGQLAREKAQRDLVFNGMRDAVIAVDLERKIFLINEAAERIFGISQTEAQGKSVAEIWREVNLEALLDACLTSRKASTREISATAAVYRITVSPLEGDEGLWGAMALIQDISDSRHLERLRRELIANVSHELRTPMTNIQGYLELALEPETDPAESREYLEIVMEETQRLNRLTSDLLDLNRLESGRIELNTRPTDLGALVRRVCKKMGPAFQRAGVQVHVDTSGLQIPVVVDPDRIEQLLSNLLDNAIRHTPEGGSVSVTVRQQGEQVELIVEDTGEGIAEEDLPYIWERFFKADKSRHRRHGSGLGLVIAKEIIDWHGGHVNVTSRPGEGTRFTVTLPMRQADGEDLRASS